MYIKNCGFEVKKFIKIAKSRKKIKKFLCKKILKKLYFVEKVLKLLKKVTKT